MVDEVVKEVVDAEVEDEADVAVVVVVTVYRKPPVSMTTASVLQCELEIPDCPFWGAGAAKPEAIRHPKGKSFYP